MEGERGTERGGGEEKRMGGREALNEGTYDGGRLGTCALAPYRSLVLSRELRQVLNDSLLLQKGTHTQTTRHSAAHLF